MVDEGRSKIFNKLFHTVIREGVISIPQTATRGAVVAGLHKPLPNSSTLAVELDEVYVEDVVEQMIVHPLDEGAKAIHTHDVGCCI